MLSKSKIVKNDSRFSARRNRGVTDFDVCSHGTIGRQDGTNVFFARVGPTRHGSGIYSRKSGLLADFKLVFLRCPSGSLTSDYHCLSSIIHTFLPNRTYVQQCAQGQRLCLADRVHGEERKR